MSNRARLTWTMFEDSDGEKSWGWRLSDDDVSSFHDAYEEDEVPKEPLPLLRVALHKATSDELELLEFHIRQKGGLYINGSWQDEHACSKALDEALEEQVL